MLNLTEKPRISGQKINLRPFTERDISPLIDILKEEDVIKLTGSDDLLDLDVVYNWYRTRNNQPDRLDLAIVLKDSDEIIGEVVLNEYNKENHTMNFRILIGENGQGKGYGTEATQLVLTYIFEKTNLAAVTLSVYPFNPRAKHVYEKIGFELKSVEKEEWDEEGIVVDFFNMKLSREKFLFL